MNNDKIYLILLIRSYNAGSEFFLTFGIRSNSDQKLLF